MANATASVNGKSNSKDRPVHEIRLGRIRAAVWENQTANGVRHNVTLTRLYKDGDKWKDSTSFGREELPLLAKVVDMAHTWLYQHAASSSAAANGEASEEVQF